MGRVRREKEVLIGDKRYVVREITPRQLLDIWEEDATRQKLDEFLFDAVGVTIDDLSWLYPSEVEQLWASFREVNGFFFRAGATFGVEKLLPAITKSLGETFGEEFASLLSMATQEQQITDGAISERQSAFFANVKAKEAQKPKDDFETPTDRE